MFSCFRDDYKIDIMTIITQTADGFQNFRKHIRCFPEHSISDDAGNPDEVFA